MMLNCVTKLCEILNCKPHELKKELEDPWQRRRAEDFIRRYDGFANFVKYKRHIGITEITTEDANKLTVCNGMGTVNQYFFFHHRIRLRHPEYPCIAFHSDDGIKYFPLELILLQPKSLEELRNVLLFDTF